MVRTLALVLAIGGAWRFKQSGLGMVDVKALLRGAVQGSVRNVMEAWRMLRKAVLA